jgi:hypothetical protein
MARVPAEELERIKSEVSLVRLVEAKGVALRKHGPDLVGRCPFHEDREPSFVVSSGKNLWYCHGACQQGGSVVDFVMRAEGVSFRHAVDLLREGVGVSAAPVVARSTVAKLPALAPAEAEDGELLARVVAFYAQTLKESSEALGYLARRRLDHAEALERFQLGYANRTLGYRLPEKNRRAGAELRGALQRLGVLRASGHEHFAGSLVVPVIEESRVLEVYGRKIRDDLRSGTPLHLYLPGPHRGVWNREALAASEELIVCESLLDALSFWCHGFRHVTAAYGVEGFGEEHLAALAEHEVRRVLIAFDGDEAGQKGARKLADLLISRGVECYRVPFARGEDANEVVVAAKVPQDALGRLLRKAVWLGSGPAPARRAPIAVEASWQPATKETTEPHSFAAPPLEPEPEPAAAEVEPALVSPAAAPEPDRPLVEERELRLVLGDRRWRVRGLERVSSFDLLRVNVLVAAGERFHVDTLDLYSARARAAFVSEASTELGLEAAVVKRDLGRVLLACEERAEQLIEQAQQPVTREITLNDEERVVALELLRSPDLVERIAADFERVGLVGERENCLVGYLAAVSRKLEQPLAVIVQSTSAAGKSALMDAVVALVPEEERVRFSAMTGQSLFYMGEADLSHKLLAISEEEGAERAAYALKLLQSEGELSIASTGKDTASGRLVTHTYRVEGPTAIMLTTTAVDVDEELLNRCVVLTVDEDRAQTRAIHERQRRRHTLAGLIASTERDKVVKLHQDAQRLLAPLAVVIPDAERLVFADAATRTRRDHVKYLTLIRAVALLHQHQRERKTAMLPEGRSLTYVEATVADVELATRLAHRVLGQSLDELPPQTRRLLTLLREQVEALAEERGLDPDLVRFTRRELRERLGLGDTQLKIHLARLVELELVHARRGEHGLLVYELAWHGEGQDGERFLAGLTHPDTATTPERSGLTSVRSGAGRPPVGRRSGAGRPGLNGAKSPLSAAFVRSDPAATAEDADRAADETAVVAEGAAG